MNWEYFGLTIMFGLIGYLIGSLSWATILSRKFKKDDIREHGSKNAGATNTLRTYGPLMGLAVFILDFAKPILAVAIAYIAKFYGGNPWNGILVQIAGLAALIGHIYPIFFKFKGGKGAACFAGLAVSMQWLLFFIGCAIFFSVALLTKKVSLGSIFAPLSLVIINLIFVFIPAMNQNWSNPMTQDPYLWVNTIILFIAWIFVVYKHKENIKRIMQGQERTLNKPKEN